MTEMNPFADQTKLKAQQFTTGRLPVLTLLQLLEFRDRLDSFTPVETRHEGIWRWIMCEMY